VSGFEADGRVYQGPEMYEKLFEEVEKKFNPRKLEEKII